jgi:hypothetical protein
MGENIMEVNRNKTTQIRGSRYQGGRNEEMRSMKNEGKESRVVVNERLRGQQSKQISLASHSSGSGENQNQIKKETVGNEEGNTAKRHRIRTI